LRSQNETSIKYFMGKKAAKKKDLIIIDEAKGLEFETEDELYKHFYKEISSLEKEFFELRSEEDIREQDFGRYEDNLSLVLDGPDEIWQDTETLKDTEFNIYIKKIAQGESKDRADDEEKGDEDPLFHVAIVYLNDTVPTFVYLHFPTMSEGLVTKYRRGTKTYDRMDDNIPLGAIEGDALHEGDEFARGLYQAMMKVRSDSDIKEDSFKKFQHNREDSIEQPDEIWRSNDSMGNILVSFIKEVATEDDKNIHYIVVTLEDMPSGSHALLFSFPTTDDNLVGRYRHGENLQADEVVQEASH
jgi:hypothetical protein